MNIQHLSVEKISGQYEFIKPQDFIKILQTQILKGASKSCCLLLKLQMLDFSWETCFFFYIQPKLLKEIIELLHNIAGAECYKNV